MLVGIFGLQFFLVERTEYVAGENRNYTYYEKYLDSKIDIASSSSYDNDFYNLVRITKNISQSQKETEKIRLNLKELHEGIFSEKSTFVYYQESADRLDKSSKEIISLSNNLKVQKNYLLELVDYIEVNEKETKSIHLYLQDINAHLNYSNSIDTTLQKYSDIASELTMIVTTTIDNTLEEQELARKREQLKSEQNLINSFARNSEKSYQPTNSINSYYKTSRNNSGYSGQSSTIRYYINTNGERVQSPTYYESQPEGATALCRDGTYSFSRNRRGTCSGHGGVQKWL